MKLNELINNLNNDLSMPDNKNLYHFSHYLEIYNGNEWMNKVKFNPNFLENSLDIITGQS